MTDTPTQDSVVDQPGWFAEWRRLVDVADQSVYEAVADTPTPRLDHLMVNVSNAANQSRLWLATAAAMAVLGGRPGRRAARQGLVAVALASAVTNLALKPLAHRRRPAKHAGPGSDSRRVRRPDSASFPSGHAASAFAFASAAGQATPALWLPLQAAAAAVAFSRVHTGVHYTSDVFIGALIGDLCGHVPGWPAPPPRRGAIGRRGR